MKMLKTLAFTVSMLFSNISLADTVTVAIQADNLPMQFYSGANVNVLYGSWVIGAAEASRGFELNAINNVVSNLNVFITSTDNTDPYPSGAALQMWVRTLPLGWSVTSSIYYDQANRPFAGTLFDSDTFTSPIDDVSWYPLTLAGSYSVTTVFNVQSSFIPGELTIDVNLGRMDAVPGPIIGAGLPGLLSLFLLFIWRRKIAYEAYSD